MKILFLTTHNFATNPRLFKEVRLAMQVGHEAEVICFEFDNWSRKINERLKDQLEGVSIVSIPAGRSPFWQWISSVVKEKFYRIAARFTSLGNNGLSQAVSRRSDIMIAHLEKVSKPDLVVGHNSGAMWPAIVAGRKFGAKVGFDVEDYHPGEGDAIHLQLLTARLMIKLLPEMNYVSFASPLIMQEMKTLLHESPANWFTILNYFPASEFMESTDNHGKVKLVWFSQNISSGRGLEFILPFITNRKNKIELHLAGNLDAAFYKDYLKDISNVIIHAPMEQKDLHNSLADFDIGLALEPAKDKNNELAISNKLLAYLQAGLFVVATNTLAQESLLNTLPGHGLCFDYKVNNAPQLLERIIEDIDEIRAQRNNRFKNFEKRNWDTSSQLLLKAWNSQVSS